MNPEMLAGDDIASIKMYLSNKGNGKKNLRKRSPFNSNYSRENFILIKYLRRKQIRCIIKKNKESMDT